MQVPDRSTAGIAYGEPRMTHDVDFVVALAPADIDAFVDAFPIDESAPLDDDAGRDVSEHLGGLAGPATVEV